tara:strand:+ start:298 stop:1365 length:1068 start_codon:yes stop_codon:yes gene_type:complete
MGLLSSASFLKGVASGALDIYDKAEEASKEGLENLKIAREEVRKELDTIGDRYDKAQSLGDSVGGGAFANYLFDTEGIDNLASLQSLAPTDRNEQLTAKKITFQGLSEEQRAPYEEGNFSQKIKEGLDTDVESEKVKQGLVANNNMGQSTANTLAGKIQKSVERTFQPRRQAIVDSIPSPTMREGAPVEGGFEAIPVPTTGIKEYSFLTDQSEIDDINTAYRAYKNQDIFLDALGNPSESAYNTQVKNAMEDYGYSRENLDKNFDDIISNLSLDLGIGPSTLKEQILFGNFIEKTYPNSYSYTGQFQLNNEITAAVDFIAYDKSKDYQEKLNELVGFGLTEDQARNELSKRNVTG